MRIAGGSGAFAATVALDIGTSTTEIRTIVIRADKVLLFI
jgi:hypothetical protein